MPILRWLLTGFAAAFMTATMAPAQAPSKPVATKTVNSEKVRDPQLEAAVRKAVEPIDSPVRYFYNRVDLNGDGKPEVLVYITGRSVCGSGGCTALVLKQNGNQYQVVSTVSLARAPILVSDHRTSGWSDLILPLAGGGITTATFAVLPFDGSKYPDNPSVSPARKLKQNARGVNYIGDESIKGSGIPLGAASH